MTETNAKPAAAGDGLDLDSFSLAAIKDRKASASDLWMKYLGFPAGIAAFLLIYLLPTPEGLTWAGQSAAACFALAFCWWVAEPIPNHVTSLLLMALLVLFGVRDEATVLSALGLSVIWLNVTAFVLSSVLVKTNLAKRLALSLVTRFGHSAWSILFAFLVLQLLLAPLIPATAARTVMTLPIMMVVAAVYGSTMERPNAFGKNLMLQNMLGINMFSSGFLTGSSANLVAAAFILDMASHRIYYTEWLAGALPVVLLTGILTHLIFPRLFFRIPPAERVPHVAGGLDRLRGELAKMGPVSAFEWKGAAIFGGVLFLWVTDKFHMGWFGFEVSAVMAALLGTVIAFFPRVGLLKWNEADIPWHLLIFSTGAYAGGTALTDTGAAQWAVGSLFDALGVTKGVGFFPVYALVIAVTAYSHILFTSKTMRTLILIPVAIAIAQKLGFDPVALALPAAFTLDWVVTLPISAKPNVILYSTGQYSVTDNLLYGLFAVTLGVLLMIVAGFTWYRYLGIIPY